MENIPIQLIFSLNFMAVGLYALFVENVILTSSNVHDKVSVIFIFTILVPLWELLKPLSLSKDYAKHIFFICFMFTYAFHIICYKEFNKKYPQFFENFYKFNFGFTIQYLILDVLNIQVNKIIPCTILGVLFTYYSSLTTDHIGVFTSNIVYSIVLIEAWIPLVIILSPSKDEAAVLFVFSIAVIATLLIYLVAVILQLRKVNSGAYKGYGEIENGGDIEKGRAITSQDNNTNSNNYSTFTN
jgi:hypothetical protein